MLASRSRWTRCCSPRWPPVTICWGRARGAGWKGGVRAGGFGSAVWESLSEEGAAVPRILRVGLPDRYVTHGAPALLHEEVGFTPQRIAERVGAAVLDPRLAV